MKKPETKAANYRIDLRLADLENIVDIQCDPKTAGANEYMRGMANGLLMAWNIMAEPYGHDVKFFPPTTGE